MIHASYRDGGVSKMIAEAKKTHPGMILVFDWETHYRVYGDDVDLLKSLGLTSCGTIGWIDKQCFDCVLRKLVEAGHRVALCEQTFRPEEKPNA